MGEKTGEETAAEEETSEEIPAAGDSGPQADKAPEEKTFITEVSVNTNKSRVTIMSPKREDTRQGKTYHHIYTYAVSCMHFCQRYMLSIILVLNP